MISSKDNNEEHVLRLKSDNKEIMVNDKVDKVFEKIFKSLLNRYQYSLEQLMKVSDFGFDYVHLLYYKCHKRNLDCGGSYIDFPDLIKNKKQQ